VLQNAHVVGQREQGIEPHLWQREPHAKLVFRIARPNPGSFRGVHTSLCQGLVVLRGDPWPDHRPAKFVRGRLHPFALAGVLKQGAKRGSKTVNVAEVHKASASIGKHFLGVTIRCRDDRGSGGERVRQRAGHNLFFVVVRRYVIVSRRQVLAKVLLGNVAVVEHDVLLETVLENQVFERQAV